MQTFGTTHGAVFTAVLFIPDVDLSALNPLVERELSRLLKETQHLAFIIQISSPQSHSGDTYDTSPGGGLFESKTFVISSRFIRDPLIASSYPMRTGGSLPGCRWAGRELTTDVHLVPRLITRGAIPLRLQY
jgi:hypothetical protein